MLTVSKYAKLYGNICFEIPYIFVNKLHLFFFNNFSIFNILGNIWLILIQVQNVIHKIILFSVELKFHSLN